MIKNNRIIVDQCTIAANEPTQVYLVIIKKIKILITHCSDNDCTMTIHTKHAPCCIGNALRIRY